MSNQPDPTPELVFEIRRTIGALTSDGFSQPRHSTEVAVRSDAALRLIQQIGPENFLLLLTLAMEAEERDGDLRVESATDAMQSALGWSRNKTNQRLRLLADAGYITRNQQVRNTAQGAAFGKGYLILHTDLYTTSHRNTPAPAPGAAENTTLGEYLLAPRISGAKQKSQDLPPVAQKPGSGTKSAGQPAAQIPADQILGSRETAPPVTQKPVAQKMGRAENSTKIPDTQKACSTETVQHHDYEDDYELHKEASKNENTSPASRDGDSLRRISDTVEKLTHLTPPPPIDVSKLDIEKADELTRQEITAVLQNWKVFDGASLAASTPLPVLRETIVAVVSRLETIQNPGAYFRKLLREGQERNSTPTPAPQPTPTPTPPTYTRPASSQPAVSETSPSPEEPDMSSEEVEAHLNQLPEDVRSHLVEEAMREVKEKYPAAVGYDYLMERLLKTQLADKLREGVPMMRQHKS